MKAAQNYDHLQPNDIINLLRGNSAPIFNNGTYPAPAPAPALGGVGSVEVSAEGENDTGAEVGDGAEAGDGDGAEDGVEAEAGVGDGAGAGEEEAGADASTVQLTNLENIGMNFAERMLTSVFSDLSETQRESLRSSIRGQFGSAGLGETDGSGSMSATLGGGATGFPSTSMSVSSIGTAPLVTGTGEVGSGWGSRAAIRNILMSGRHPSISNFVNGGMRIRGGLPVDFNESVKVVVDKDELSKFKKVKFADLLVERGDGGVGEAGGGDRSGACVICMCDYEADEDVTVMPNCIHFFHEECINKWLGENSNKCPVCKAECGKGTPLL